MKKFLALTLAILLMFALIGCKAQKEDATEEENEAELAQTSVYGDFTYASNAKGELEIIGYVNTSEELINVVIPEQIEGRTIVGIGASAFATKSNIATISFPDTITYIADFAFVDCDYLIKLDLPKGLTTIGMGAFRSCDSLMEVSFPNALLSIGEGAFSNCKNLTNFTLPENLLTIEDGAFQNCVSLTNVTIPASIIDLGDGAFIGCKSLQEVNLLGNVNISPADAEILTNVNELIQNSGKSFATAAQVADFLEEEGYYLSGITSRGVKFIWDTNTDKIYGAITAADEILVASINTALIGDTSKDASNALELMISNMKGKGFDPNQLNASVASDKYVWDSEKNQFITIYAGIDAFSGCTTNTIISVTTGSFFAKYAENSGWITVDPATAPEGAKIFSNGTLAFYYPEAWKMEVLLNTEVRLVSATTYLNVATAERNVSDDHTTWTIDNFNAYIESTNLAPLPDGQSFVDQAISQITNENGITATKISFAVTDGTYIEPIVIYLVTIGNQTYTITTSQQATTAEIQSILETSFASL